MKINKSELRKQIKLTLKYMSRDLLIDKSKKLSINLSTILEKFTDSNDLIGGFAPIEFEPIWQKDTSGLEGRTCYPSLDNLGQMIFCKCDYDCLVEDSIFGVNLKVPPRESQIVLPKILIIPGLAFSKSGERLGRGKGFYDRYLSSYDGLKVGICFNEQLMEEVPTESHDIKMDYLVTDKTVVEILKI